MRLLLITLVLFLSGCAGLSVNFDAAISYRSDVPLAEPLRAPVAIPPALPASGAK
jgi:hypothetical protein